MIKKIRIYDIDGTITKPGHDLWHLTTRSLANDPKAFDDEVGRWKGRIKQGCCPYTESLQMMKTGIGLMQGGLGDAKIREETRERTAELIRSRLIFVGAIDHIRASIQRDFKVVFATTNYQSGGHGFVAALRHAHLLNCYEADSIAVSGSLVNWDKGEVLHFNMDTGKAIGVCNILGHAYESLERLIDSSYGDDPAGNDRAIMRMAPRAYVIQNDKNRNITLEANMTIADWDHINRQESLEPIPHTRS